MNLNVMIGSKIATLRKQQGMTQEQLAEKLDISVKHCSSVERGLSCLSLEKLIEVSEMFDVSLDFLLKEKKSVSISHGCLCHELPSSIVNVMHSDNEKEKALLKEFLHLYTKLRNTD